jgi:hypothetical protein
MNIEISISTLYLIQRRLNTQNRLSSNQKQTAGVPESKFEENQNEEEADRMLTYIPSINSQQAQVSGGWET